MDADLPTVINLDKPLSDRSSISVICPMYNEGAKIQDNLHKLFDALSQLSHPWEVILVNDGSTDDSFQKATAGFCNRTNFTVVTYETNRGRGYAIRQGIAAAQGDIIVVTESDLSWGGDIVARMVTKLTEDNLDVVVASPHAQNGKLENVPFLRRCYTVGGNKILRLLMPVKLSMYTGMTRAYRGDILRGLTLWSDGKEIHLEIISKLTELGYRIGEVPAVLAWEPGRKKRTSGFKARRYIFSHLAFGIGESPLFFLSIISLVFILLGCIGGLYLLALSLSGTPVAGRPLIQFSMLSIIVGIFMVVFGFLAQQNRSLERKLHFLQGEFMKKSTKEDKDADGTV